ncbi:MAG: hypothetical protein ACK40G_13850 [Cytophagaceae bacterium]
MSYLLTITAKSSGKAVLTSLFPDRRKGEKEVQHIIDTYSFPEKVIIKLTNVVKDYVVRREVLEASFENFDQFVQEATIGEDILEFADKIIELNFEYRKKVLFQIFKEKYPKSKHTVNKFTKGIKLWCDLKGYKYNYHKMGNRDLRNGIDYMTIIKNQSKAIHPISDK